MTSIRATPIERTLSVSFVSWSSVTLSTRVPTPLEARVRIRSIAEALACARDSPSETTCSTVNSRDQGAAEASAGMKLSTATAATTCQMRGRADRTAASSLTRRSDLLP